MTLRFEVTTSKLNIRSKPVLEDDTIIGAYQYGDIVEVDEESRRNLHNVIWWKHDAGWSAERSHDGSWVYMMPAAGEAPIPAFKFKSLPVDLAQLTHVYYYGNTIYAYNHGHLPDHNYQIYSQSLHAGLDLGHSGGLEVRAGVRGIYLGPQQSFGPMRCDVQCGEYRLIYGHLGTLNSSLTIGADISPGTLLGTISSTKQHLHLEVRTPKLIYNPLLFMPASMRDRIFDRFPATGNRAFQPWHRWQTPTEQPTIWRGGPIKGPRAELEEHQ